MRLFHLHKKNDEKENEEHRRLIIKKIAAEMVNITYGETYFDINGDLLKKKKPGHNAYLIDMTEYNIIPNKSKIYLPENFDITPAELIRMYGILVELAKETFDLPPSEKTITGTTHYMKVQEDNVSNDRYVLICEDEDASPGPTIDLVWVISKYKHLPLSDFKIPRLPNCTTLLNYPEYNIIESLSCIVVIPPNITVLPDGYRSPDYPSYKDYISYIENRIYDKPIYFNPYYGIHKELTRHFPNVATFPTQTKEVDKPIPKYPVRLIPWDWIKPYTISTDTAISWDMQIQMGLFDNEPNEEVSYTCAVSGMPIYDDCYVFDIVEQEIELSVEESELDNYPGAVKIEEKESTDTSVVFRKETDSSNECKIKYIKKYHDDPKCILISTYFMHMAGITSPVSYFETMTKTKILVYRTKCPITVHQIIQESTAPELLKKMLIDLYKNAFLNGTTDVLCGENTSFTMIDQIDNLVHAFGTEWERNRKPPYKIFTDGNIHGFIDPDNGKWSVV